MKKIPKKTLDYLIFMLKEIYKKDEKGELISPELSGACKITAWKLERSTNFIIGYSAFESFLDGILRKDGIKTDATNEEIYEIFKLLGVEVVDE